ncbi:MAG: hypothetical protein IPL28_10545 [Chloroflexi bacterium]|nr:hypothetical protein [Chloroflexota bacterium]
MALNIAKDVADDLIPAEYRPALLVALVGGYLAHPLPPQTVSGILDWGFWILDC